MASGIDATMQRIRANIARQSPTVAADRAAAAQQMLAKARREVAQRIPRHYRDATLTHPDVHAWVTAHRTGHPNGGGASLLLLGPTGVGKTWEAFAAVRAVAVPDHIDDVVGWRPIRWEYTTYPELADELRPRDDGGHRTALRRYQTAPLLLLDDLGAGKTSDWSADWLHRLIDHRWAHCLPTIITSNLTPAELRDTVGDRITSRLAGMCTVVTLHGQDRRRSHAPAP